ncbi:MAG: division/cell wall cluster transcriptional repressor MraZ [Cyclobacteriaceae bacterium]|nr:division/cell wall cluster transcriptional repressor MraZ [Cyclobacteriaceae bacterium]MCK5279682.1 division/cell wall cluster transcriptional repressor MraZ [Cyclobacteriaceae bacterium]MCK5701418.1 division/cell wall cluster transcriptional repressor MraZ [Cyclobacteriaceae bacterium]
MSLFTGEYECKMDAKGRLTLPSKVKSRLPEVSGNQLVLSLGLEPCLVLYPLMEYRKIYSRIASMNEFNEEFRKLQRIFFRRISEVELDGAGRLLIPKPMSKYANLKKEIILVGLGNRIELWDPSVYEEYIISDNSEISKLAQKHLTE